MLSAVLDSPSYGVHPGSEPPMEPPTRKPLHPALALFGLVLLLAGGPAGCSDGGAPDDDDSTGGDDDDSTGSDDDDSGADDDDSAGGPDLDGDGWPAVNDCDDTDASVHPDATELCDGKDNDCDGQSAVFEDDQDGDGRMDCDALLWAIDVISYGFYADLVDQLETLVTDEASSGCPAPGASSEAVTVTSRDGVDVTTTASTSSWAGPCSSSDPTITGSIGFTDYDAVYQPVDPDWSGVVSGQSMAAVGFDLSWSSDPSVADSLSLDGTVTMTSDATDTIGAVEAGDEWASIEIALLIGSEGSEDELPEPLRDTTTQLNLSVTHTLVTCHGEGEGACNREEETFTAAGAATANPATRPWLATADFLSWSYAFELDDDSGDITKSGCYREPASGAITVMTRDTPGGAVTWTGVIAFDGQANCDGCGTVTVDGTQVGPWCGLAPLEEPSDEVP